MHEEWRPVPGYCGYYEVSNQGRVRSLDRLVAKGKRGALIRVRGRILLQKRSSQIGYPAVNLNRDGRAETWPVHRLVMLAFVGPLPGGHQTRHLNGDHTDNRLTNLAYGSPVENTADKFRHGTFRTRKTVATHCQHGHEFTPENTDSTPAGHRSCRECRRRRDRDNKRARRDAARTALQATQEADCGA